MKWIEERREVEGKAMETQSPEEGSLECQTKESRAHFQSGMCGASKEPRSDTGSCVCVCRPWRKGQNFII